MRSDRSTLLLLAGLLAAACSPARVPPPAVTEAAPPALPVSAGTVVEDTVDSPALRGNPLGDPSARRVAVYLPPSYRSQPGRRYPVMYLLHGFDGDPSQWTERMRLPAAMDSLVAAGRVREMIVVMPDAKNLYGGAFYANSPATGRWEDFLVRDVVRHVDRHYRTLPHAESRGVAGWSMGGWGALHLAAAHPDAFGAAYALSPYGLGGVLEASPAWEDVLALRTPREAAGASFAVRLRLALAAVLTPDEGRPPFRVALPFARGVDGVVPAEPAYSAWAAATPDTLASRHGAALARLRGLAFDAGTADAFPGIPVTVRALDAALTRAGIAHTAELYEGTHGSRVPERLRTRLLPFFSERLAFQSSRR